ncbi:MAG: MFS transporter [Candidatus Zambryskibacteria bacterium]|nr:MFS transporter [Candidatus Zambryskibacteria bacterium]
MFRFIPSFVTVTFLSLHMGALLYVNSSFLERFFSSDIVGLLFVLSAIGNILFFLISPRLLNMFNRDFLLFVFLSITAASTLGLCFATTPFATAFWFVLYSSVLFMNYYFLDILLEELSSDKRTGEIRGVYLTFLNIGIAGGPLFAGLIKANEFEQSAYQLVYLAGFFLLIIPIVISIFFFKTKKYEKVQRASLRLPFKKWWQRRNVRAITLSRAMLEMFYTIMVIYTPIYLHTRLGFTWAELSIIFSVALVPFILFQWPAGELADRYIGEREILSLGFFTTGIALLLMPFLGKVFLAWMLVLFLSRIGASLIEVMTESYFFKKIDHKDTGLISIFRISRSAGIILGAIVGAINLNLFSFEKIFFVLAIVVFFGLRESLYIKDTL